MQPRGSPRRLPRSRAFFADNLPALCREMSIVDRITVVLALGAIAATAVAPVDGCSADRPIVSSDFTITCGRDNDYVFNVEITCKPEQSWSSFPRDKLQLDENAIVVFQNCSFPERLSLLNVTRALGLTSVSDLRFETSLSELSREHLKGFKLKSLEFRNTLSPELPSDLLYDIENLETLFIVDVGLQVIPKDFFQRSVNLSYLEIIDNQLDRLKVIDLAGLENLTELLLFGNEIEQIEPGAFDHLTKLRLLELSQNQLRALPSHLFKKLVQLEVLNLSQNDFDILPEDLLRIEESRLQRVRLNHNRGALTSLPDGFFGNLSSLSYAELMSNNFTSIPEDAFLGTVSLRELNLSGNSLVSLPPKIFKSSKKLSVLHLSNNSLETLPAGIFQNANLEKLFLNFNRLTNLSSDVLTGLTNLKELYIVHNNLTHIDGDACNHLRKLEFIDLSHNELVLRNDDPRIANFYSSLLNCNTLKELNLSYNKLPNVYPDWSFMPELKSIDLEGNNISLLDANDIGILHVNANLNLRNNKISTIDLSNLERLVHDYSSVNFESKNSTVILNDNPLNCDCNLVDFFRYVEKRMSEAVRGYAKLEIGNLRCAAPAQLANLPLKKVRSEQLRCEIKSIEPRDACNETCTCWDYPAKQLLLVDCSRRNLTKVPGLIGNLNNRSIELDLSGNLLRETPGLDHSYLLNVVSLDLSSNNISTVSLPVFSKRLRMIKLHGNRISRLSDQIVQYLSEDTSLSNLTLHDNHWICDCETRNFLSVIQTKQLYDIMCYDTNRRLFEMTAPELCESALVIIVVVSLLIALFGIVLGILAALYYRYQEEVKVWLYSKQMCLWVVTEDELDKEKQYDAFISYSHKDEDFVEKEIVTRLEEGPKSYKLCLHYRDWLAGEWIPVQIARSVSESRRTIVVLSPNFLESVWGRMEFRTAHSQALSEGRARVIVILYGDIGDTENLDPELKAYLSMNTYVKWGDPWFWDKLRYALPHRYETSKRRSRTARIMENHLAQLPAQLMNNHHDHGSNGKAEIIAMPKITANNDSAKLLDTRTENG